MKSRFLRLISSLLILSFLVAAFSVFSFAEDTGDSGESEGENTDNLSVLLNRGYEEGWDYNNGFSYRNISTNKVYIDHDENILGKYNYFIRYEAASNSAAQTRINFGTEAVSHASKDVVGGTVVEFSIKADDIAKLGNIVWMTSAVGRDTVKMLDIDANQELIAFNGVNGGSVNLGKLENEWVNIAYVFDWTKSEVDSTTFYCTIKVGYGLGNGYSESYDLTLDFIDVGDLGLFYLYFGFPAYSSRADKVAANSYGMSYCLDNIKVYQGVKNVIELDATNYGSLVNSLAEKVIDIQEAAGIKSKAQLLEEALAMKLGVDYALLRNVRYSLLDNADRDVYSGVYGAPVKQGDDVLIPLQLLLDYIGFPSYIHPDNVSFDITTGSSTTYITLGRDSATVDGERVMLSVAPGYLENSDGEQYLVIALDDVPVLFPGWLAIYDDMGLVIIYEDTTPEDLTDNAPIVNRKEDLTTMVDIMKKFVFDTVTARELADGYVQNGELIYNDTKANTGLDHPYIIADSETFEKLASKYKLSDGAEGYDEALKSYIAAIVAQADECYAEYARVVAGAYVGIVEEKQPVSTYTGDGYNAKGQMTELVEFASILPTLAFAYQMTGNTNYAKLAYDWSYTIAGWTHWGPGYITHCAEVTSYFAISYDWLYDAYTELGLDTEILAGAIYKLGVHDGYVSSSGMVCEHARSLGDLSAYVNKTNSTNAVATSGMMIGALAILDYIGTENAPEAAYSETIYLLGNNIQNLVQNGLDIYAPDGSYIESATYWEYATSALFRMIMAVNSSTGTDYGLMDTWGLDKTCYYAIHIESSDGFIWNYHDGGVDGITANIYEPEELASLNTDMFNFVGAYLGDANLLAVRAHQLKNGKEATIYDLIFYPFDGITKTPELTLNYHMEAIEGYVSRSDWNSGAMYTGLMGGMNNVNHGHLDSGNFIYRNRGINWVIDLGTENPYINEYDVAGSRYKYYRVSAEGQNVVIMTNNPNVSYGQYSAAGGYINKVYENEHGSYVLLDNSPVYLSTVSYAKRGVLVTNDRSTVVLQDEISFVKVESLAWVLHTGSNISILDGGRVAYLEQKDVNGKNQTLRLTIVSQRPDFVFTEQSVTKPMLTATYTSDKISGEPEYPRNGISRLVIESTTISFDVAVVFEIIDDVTNVPKVGYTWTPMSTWEPTAPSTGEDGDVEVEASKRPEADKMDIKNSTSTAETILKKKTAYTTKLGDLYEALTTVCYTLKYYKVDNLEQALISSYADYIDCVDSYDEYRAFINGNAEVLRGFTISLSGIVAAEDLD